MQKLKELLQYNSDKQLKDGQVIAFDKMINPWREDYIKNAKQIYLQNGTFPAEYVKGEDQNGLANDEKKHVDID